MFEALGGQHKIHPCTESRMQDSSISAVVRKTQPALSLVLLLVALTAPYMVLLTAFTMALSAIQAHTAAATV